MDSFLVRVVSYALVIFFRPARIWIGLRRALAILALAFAFGPMLALARLILARMVTCGGPVAIPVTRLLLLVLRMLPLHIPAW